MKKLWILMVLTTAMTSCEVKENHQKFNNEDKCREAVIEFLEDLDDEYDVDTVFTVPGKIDRIVIEVRKVK